MSPYDQNGYGPGQSGSGIQAPQETQNQRDARENQPYGWQQGYAPGQPGYSGSWNSQQGQGWQQPYQPRQDVPAPQTGWSSYGYYQEPQPVQPAAPAQQTVPAPNFTTRVLTFLLNCMQDRKKGMLLLAGVVGVIVLVAVLAAAGKSVSDHYSVNEYVNAYADRYCEGVYVDGIHLGGMTRQEAENAVTAQAQQRFDSWSIRLVTKDGTGQDRLVGRITAETLNMTVDVTQALDEAWQQGRQSLTVEDRKAEMDALKADNYHGATAQPSGNTSAIDVMLANLAASAYLAPADAVASFDPKATNPFTITPETYGRMLETAPIRAQIFELVERMESATIEVKTTVIAPDVTSEQLEAVTALRGSAYTLISTTSTENRNKNIIRACELMNGKVIGPGETFSFNGVVGKRTTKNGFYPAIEYAYGEQREGIGGGVCQVSSTIYITAVRAGMEITKREQHSQEVNYTTYGLDATVNYDGNVIDFKFRNNTSSNIYITARVQRDPKINKSRDIVLINIYGEALPEGTTYDLVAGITETIPAPTEPELIVDKEGKYAIYNDEQVEKRKAENGCVVESYRVTYVDGKEVRREFMYRDNYPAKAQQFWVGVSERPLDFSDFDW